MILGDDIMKIFGWEIGFYCDITEWGIPFAYRFYDAVTWREYAFGILFFGVVFAKDT